MKVRARKLLISFILLFMGITNVNTSMAAVIEGNEVGYTDPFAYNEDGESKYPENNSHSFNNDEQKETVSNFDFSKENYLPGLNEPGLKQLLGGNSFEGGYHEYLDGDGNLQYYQKKIVKPTDNPNLFEIELDVITNKIKEKPNVDIAFVIDKSGSMNAKVDASDNALTRWDVLLESFNRFSDRLLPDSTNNYIPNFETRFALSSFSSVLSDPIDYDSYIWWYDEWFKYPTSQTQISMPRVDIQKFNSSYFTNDKNTFKKSDLFVGLPDGGTPTFLGVDAGVELLRNSRYGSQADAHKFLIFVTDGEPTYDRNSIYPGLLNLPNKSSNQNLDTYILDDYNMQEFDTSNEENKSFAYLPVGSEYIGNGANGGSGSLSTFPEKYNELLLTTKEKYSTIPDVGKYSIGIGDSVSKFEDVLDVIGESKSYQVTNNISVELEKVFSSIEEDINKKALGDSIATLVDPMSKFVTLKTDTIREYDLVLENQEITASLKTDSLHSVINENEIIVDNLVLNSSDTSLAGYRLSYQVELKEEYRDGQFYPANNPTYLYDSTNTTGLGFAVPSIKNNYRDIPVEKEWAGNQTPKPMITLILKANSEEVGQVDLVDGETKHVFQNYPILDDKGKLINYEIEEIISETDVSYTNEVIQTDTGGFKVINTPVSDFETEKIATKTKLVPGEGFQYKINVTNTVDGSVIKQLKVEDTIPEWIEIVGNLQLDGQPAGTIEDPSFSVIVNDLKGGETAEVSIDVRVKDTAPVGQIQNIATVTDLENPETPKHPEANIEVSRETDLTLVKTNLNGLQFLEGAEFELYQMIDGENVLLESQTSNNNGVVLFEKLKVGSYSVIEKKAPSGFQTLEQSIEIKVDEFGVITLISPSSEMIEFKDENNKFELVVKNKKVGGILPKTGGNGYEIYRNVALLLIALSASLLAFYGYRNRRGWLS